MVWVVGKDISMIDAGTRVEPLQAVRRKIFKQCYEPKARYLCFEASRMIILHLTIGIDHCADHDSCITSGLKLLPILDWMYIRVSMLFESRVASMRIFIFATLEHLAMKYHLTKICTEDAF